MPFYSSNGLKLHYAEQGRGAPLILLHGFGQDSSGWIDPLPTYSRFFRVVAADMRGCGESEGAEPGYSPKDLAGDMLALMDHLGLRKVHFAGWSLGGTVGIELGAGHSDRLLSLSLHSTWAGGLIPNQERWIELRKKVMRSGDKDLDVDTRLISFFSPDFANRHGDRLDAFIEREKMNPAKFSSTGIAGQAVAGSLHDGRGRLNQITAPTLVTVGSADRTTLPAQSRYLHEQIPGSEFVLIDGAGHFTQYECPGEFVSVSLGFMLKHSW